MTDDTTPTTAPAAPATAETSPDAINLRAPSKYLAAAAATAAGPSGTSTSFVAPSTEWLSGTWAVTHSTLSMWRSAQNVRITYTPRQPAAGVGPAVNDNLVEYENKGGRGGVKRVLGVEKPDPAVPGAWNWRGRGLLMIASSHWEVLGWGERPLAAGEGGVERWAVTWFAPTLFTEEGLDLYSDRREGLSKRTADDILAALKRLEAVPKLVQLVEKKMTEVAISLPWKEGSK